MTASEPIPGKPANSTASAQSIHSVISTAAPANSTTTVYLAREAVSRMSRSCAGARRMPFLSPSSYSTRPPVPTQTMFTSHPAAFKSAFLPSWRRNSGRSMPTAPSKRTAKPRSLRRAGRSNSGSAHTTHDEPPPASMERFSFPGAAYIPETASFLPAARGSTPSFLRSTMPSAATSLARSARSLTVSAARFPSCIFLQRAISSRTRPAHSSSASSESFPAA